MALSAPASCLQLPTESRDREAVRLGRVSENNGVFEFSADTQIEELHLNGEFPTRYEAIAF
jgi:hypothetical protein